MKVGVKLPNIIIGKIKSSCILTKNNIANMKQPINLPWWINLELLNRSTNNTTFRFIKRHEIGYSVTINEGIENFKPKNKDEIKSTSVLQYDYAIVNVNYTKNILNNMLKNMKLSCKSTVGIF